VKLDPSIEYTLLPMYNNLALLLLALSPHSNGAVHTPGDQVGSIHLDGPDLIAVGLQNALTRPSCGQKWNKNE